MTFHIGLFLPSTRGLSILATGDPPQTMPTFALNLSVTRMAEAAGLDYVLSASKWRGYGGQSRHWDYSLESFTLMSALAAATHRIQLYASVGVRAFHPAVIAKMAATIDEVSGGRFGVNIVAGWNEFEYGQMGMWPEDGYHQYRYAYAEEFLEVMRKLWATGRASHQGRFFTLEDCMSYPTPSRALPIVCAGQSDAALAFTARHADIGFVGRMHDTPQALGTLNARLQTLAAEQGRRVGAYALMNIIAASSDDEAMARQDEFLARADQDAIDEWLRASGRDPNRNSHELDHLRQTFMGFPFITASFENVARRIDAIAEAGVAGVCLMFPDFERDLGAFIEQVLPRLDCRRTAIA
ncbi:MAG: LLM class flavin-dependent oxidoreductase [Gammaproteobacteria bacterium]|nr:LLM class flavin-dependent oxidoreductase [Gammaproteobacteria bacterium]